MRDGAARVTASAQLDSHPPRPFYAGRNLERARTIGDLRARTHKRVPRFVLEYLEGGSEDEATLARDRDAYGDWRFIPRTLMDVSKRSLTTELFGRPSAMPVIVAPTGLNGVFQRGADVALARAAAKSGVPFVQSTMSNETIEAVAATPALRHWFQLYVFGEDRIWQTLVDRARAAGCEALVLTSNSQIFGNREWDERTRGAGGRPSLATIANAAVHPAWALRTLAHGMPAFANVIDFVPPAQRGFFSSATWIREQMPKSLSWDTLRAIRARWTGPLIIKGLLSPEDARIALSCGVDGIVLSSHGGRQMDWAVAPLDVLPRVRDVVGTRATLLLSGGIRRGTDLLKALALGADAVMTGRAPLYGLCAAGAQGAAHALDILHREGCDAMGLLGVNAPADLGPHLLAHCGRMALPTKSAPPMRKAS